MGTHRISYASDLGWANGEAPSALAGAPASHDPDNSDGIDIFRSIGELRSGFSSTEIGGATVTDNITNMRLGSVYDGVTATRELFAYGSSGRFYRITDAATPAVTLIDTVANNADGLEIYKNFVYYAQTTQIGRYGSIAAASPTSTNAFITGLTATVKGTTIKHPLMNWNDLLWIGDSNLLKYTDGTTGTGTTIMTLMSDLTITALAENGPLLLIGAGQEQVEDTESKVQAWLFTRNSAYSSGITTNAPTDAFKFPEPYIHKIAVVEGSIYVFGLHYLYKLVGSTFKIVTKLDTRIATDGADVRQGQLYFKGSGDIRAIGTPDPQLPSARYRPYASTGTSITAIKWMQDAKLWVADNNDLNEFKTGSATAVTWRSRIINFGQVEAVEEIRIYTAANLASGDDVRVQIINEVGTATDAATFDFATYGAVNSLILRAHNLTNAVAHLTSMQIGVKFQGGAARVKEVIVITKPVSQP